MGGGVGAMTWVGGIGVGTVWSGFTRGWEWNDDCVVGLYSDGDLLAALWGTIGGSCHKYNFCRDKGFKHDKTLLLLRQKYACRDKTFVTTNIFLCLSRQNTSFVATKIFCHNKHNFVATSILLS